jgi:Na+-driven multidrug efflux pump
MALAAALIVSHVLLIVGCYLFARGINLVVRGSARAKEVLTSPLFWGLFMILGGLCMIFSPWVLPALRQALS